MIYHVTYTKTGGINSYVNNLHTASPKDHNIVEVERGKEMSALQSLLAMNSQHHVILHDPSFLNHLQSTTSVGLSIVLHGDNSYYYSAVEGYGQLVDGIISVSQTITNNIPKRFLDKTLTLGPSIAYTGPSSFPPQERKNLNLIFVAREDRNKGAQHLPTIDRTIIKAGLSANWTIVLGSRPEKITRFRSWLIKHDSRIKLLENQPNHTITKLISNHDALILPSKTEGHPMVLIEALSQSVPPFTFHYTATCKDHLPTDPEGIVSPSTSPEELAGKIVHHHQRSFESLQTWQGLAQQYVAHHHNPRRQTELLMNFLESLPNKSKSPSRQLLYKWKRRIQIITGTW